MQSLAQGSAKVPLRVPEELLNRHQWVFWKEVPSIKGKPDKVPHNPRTGAKASSVNRNDWATFQEATDACQRRDGAGIGYVLTKEDGIAVVDLDNCRNPESGEINHFAQGIVEQLDSLTEVSHSGTGLHVWCKATSPKERNPNKTGWFELYADQRFIAYTGKLLNGHTELQERTEQLEMVLRQVLGDPPAFKKPQWSASPPMPDKEVLEKALRASNGGRISRLYVEGNHSDYESQSEADLALLSHLAFYTQDVNQLARLFRASKLYREKWERDDYRERTIGKVLDGLTDTYQGRGKAAKQAAEVIVTSFADMDMHAIDWLWQDYVVLGKVNELLGDPGLGKSTIACDIAARVSTGRPMPGGTEGNPLTDLDGPAGVLILSLEDDPTDIIKPRLVAAEADLSRVFTMKLRTDEQGVMLPDLSRDVEHIQSLVLNNDVKLIVVDPLVAYLGEQTDTHTDAKVRRALAPLIEMAHETNVALLTIRHLNKNEGVRNPSYRGGGSIAFTAQARSSLLVGLQGADSGGGAPPARILTVGKSNYAAAPTGWRYELEPVVVGNDERPDGRTKDIVATRVNWLGISEVTAAQLLSPQPEEKGKLKTLREFLADMLKGGPVRAPEMQEACKNAGHSWNTVNNTKYKKRLGVESYQQFTEDGVREWWWDWETKIKAGPKKESDDGE